MKTMIPADVRVILDLEQGAVLDVDICTEVAKWDCMDPFEMVMVMWHKASFGSVFGVDG